MDVDGKTVILTGATGGIGSALTRELIQAGARVVAVGRSAARLAVLASTLPEDRLFGLAADLGTAAGRSTLRDYVRTLEVAPTLLILGHAQSAFSLFQDQTAEEVEQLLSVNLVASALLIHGLLPEMDLREGAAIVAIGSTFGSIGFPGFSAYSASKFGLRGLFESLAREYGDGVVRFQYLSPRATRTSFNSPKVDALNAELKTAYDTPEAVASQVMAAIRDGARRRQFGWPEKLFARINGAFAGVVDKSLIAQLPIIRRHARRTSSTHQETLHESAIS